MDVFLFQKSDKIRLIGKFSGLDLVFGVWLVFAFIGKVFSLVII
jgi:hypothetical protein